MKSASELIETLRKRAKEIFVIFIVLAVIVAIICIVTLKPSDGISLLILPFAVYFLYVMGDMYRNSLLWKAYMLEYTMKKNIEE